MCGRYSLQTASDELAERYSADLELDGFIPGNMLFPGQYLPVVTEDQGSNHLKLMHWGLIPKWSKDHKLKLINARFETLDQKPTFKNLLDSQRCLIPVTSFYEWDQDKKLHQFKQNDLSIFSLAGLFETSTDSNNQIIQSYTIITTQPSTIVASVHDRMPAIIDLVDETTWLDNNLAWQKVKYCIKSNLNLSHEQI